MLPKSHRLTRFEFIQTKKLGKPYPFAHFSVIILSPFAEKPDRKIGNECEEFLLRRDSTPDEALGRNPDRKVVGVSSQPESKFSIVTSSKFNKSAVIRNKFRRQLYNTFSSFPQAAWLILYPKPSMLKLSHDQISSLVTSVLSPLFVP